MLPWLGAHNFVACHCCGTMPTTVCATGGTHASSAGLRGPLSPDNPPAPDESASDTFRSSSRAIPLPNPVVRLPFPALFHQTPPVPAPTQVFAEWSTVRV